MLRRKRLPGPVVLFALFATSICAQSTAWNDSSPHKTTFVEVEKGVRLEVLDWGGSGRPLVLLAGGGFTAHVFDDFALRLTAHCHVYGITRRGFGASGFSAVNYGADRLGDDVVAVMDALKLKKPVLAGHSLAGEEMSSVANRHPGRVAGLIYLEAAYPYAFDNGRGPAMKEFFELRGPQPPEPGAADLGSFATLQSYFARVDGFQYPEGELRQQWESTAEGRATQRRNPPGGPLLLNGMKKYASIPAPALVIFANPHSQGAWVDRNADPEVRKAAEAYSTALNTLTQSQINAVESGVPGARVITMANAHHFVFLSNQDEVLREMRLFLTALH